MRWHLKLMIVMLAAFVGLTLATSQAQFQMGGAGGLGGPLRQGCSTQSVGVVRNKGVKKELRLTDEQLDKVDAAVWERLPRC